MSESDPTSGGAVAPPSAQPAPGAVLPLLSYQQGSLKAYPNDWTRVQVFGLDLSQQSRVISRMMLRQVLLKVPMVLLYLVLLHYMVTISAQFMLAASLSMVAAYGLSTLFWHWRFKQRLTRQWPTFRLIVSDQGLMRTCMDYPDIRILQGEITSLREHSQGLLVRTRQRVVYLVVPRHLEDFPTARDAIARLRPIDPRPSHWLAARNFTLVLLIALLFMGIAMVGTWSHELWLELTSLAVVLAITVLNIATMFRSPNVAASQKYASLVMIIFPIWIVAKILMERHPTWFHL